jgi:hypothetical protein
MFNILVGILLGVLAVMFWPEILFFVNEIGVCNAY